MNKCSLKANVHKKEDITLMIHPTPYGGFDILAIGAYQKLEQLSHKIGHSHLIKSSKFGGIPILVMDTCDTLRGTLSCIKAYRTELFDKFDK